MDLDFVSFSLDKASEREHLRSKSHKIEATYTAHDLASDAKEPLVRLHNEILRLVDCEKPNKLRSRQRKDVIVQITRLIKEVYPQARVEVFGSEATGIITLNSDLDLSVTIDTHVASGNGEAGGGAAEGNVDAKEAESGTGSSSSESIEVMMENICANIRNAKLCSYLEVIGARVPIIKLDHSESGVGVDICVNNASGVSAAKLMCAFLQRYPCLRPLGIVLKVYLSHRNLNDTFTGGIGSYVLLSMIVSFLQHREKQLKDAGFTLSANLGVLLLEFFELYGGKFNFVETGITMDGKYFSKRDRVGDWFDASRPTLLSIENPHDPGMDMGKNSYFMGKVRRAFEHGRQVMQALMSDDGCGAILPNLLRVSSVQDKHTADTAGETTSHKQQQGKKQKQKAKGVKKASVQATKKKRKKTESSASSKFVCKSCSHKQALDRFSPSQQRRLTVGKAGRCSTCHEKKKKTKKLKVKTGKK